MPIEAAILDALPAPLTSCPKCGAEPFRPFMRGQVQRSPWPWWAWFALGFLWMEPRPYCCVICWQCKEIVGHE